MILLLITSTTVLVCATEEAQAQTEIGGDLAAIYTQSERADGMIELRLRVQQDKFLFAVGPQFGFRATLGGSLYLESLGGPNRLVLANVTRSYRQVASIVVPYTEGSIGILRAARNQPILGGFGLAYWAIFDQDPGSWHVGPYAEMRIRLVDFFEARVSYALGWNHTNGFTPTVAGNNLFSISCRVIL